MIELVQGWKDYILIDAGDGERLESWAGVTVIRPDPQAFWPKCTKWPTPHMHYHRESHGGGTWQTIKPAPHKWTLAYPVGNQILRFFVRPTGFKHMGLFPEQAVNWQRLHSMVQPAHRILNLFAYTGGATLVCLAAGASVTHVDASKGMNAQAKENITLSSLPTARIITDDVKKFLGRELRRGNKYDGIIMDPPAYGRGPSGETWKLENDLFSLVTLCEQLLSPNAAFLLINTYAASFSTISIQNALKIAMKHRDGKTTAGEIGILAKSDMQLPCGGYALWEG